MALTTGTVDCLRISESATFTTIRDSAGTTETFLLWYFPTDINSFTRVLHSMWVSLLREAHSNGSSVTIVHGDDSAIVDAVQLGSG